MTEGNIENLTIMIQEEALAEGLVWVADEWGGRIDVEISESARPGVYALTVENLIIADRKRPRLLRDRSQKQPGYRYGDGPIVTWDGRHEEDRKRARQEAIEKGLEYYAEERRKKAEQETE